MLRLKAISLYAFSSFMEKGLAFLLIPVLTFYLSPEDLGNLAIFNSFSQLTYPLVSLGLWSYVSVQYSKLELTEFKRSFIAVISLIIFNSLIICILYVLVFPIVEKFVNIPFLLLIVIPIVGMFNAVFNITQALYEIRSNPKLFFINNSIRVGSSIGFSLLYIIQLGFGYIGRIFGIYTSEAISFLVGLVQFQRNKYFGSKVSKERIIRAAKFGIPLIPHLIGQVAISSSDRFFIASFVSIEQAGIYDIAYRISMIVGIAGLVLMNVWRPWLYKLLKFKNEDKNGAKLVLGTYAFNLVIVFVFIGLWIVSPILYNYLIDPRFSLGVDYIFGLGLANMLFGAYLSFSGFLFYNEKTLELFKITSIAILLNLVFNFILIDKLGTFGAIYSTIISYLYILIFVFVKTLKFYKNLPWFKFTLLLDTIKARQ